MKKITALFLLTTLMTGCVTAMIEDDATRTVTEAALAGGGAGAIIGGLLGEFVRNQPVLWAIAGAIIGSATGGIYGNHVANKKRYYATQEAYLDACIEEAQRINEQTRQYNAFLRSDIRRLNQEANTILTRYNRQQADKDELAAERQKVQAEFQEAVEQLKRATDELLIQKEVRKREQHQAKAYIARLDEKITRLEQVVSELGQHTQVLASINQRLDLG